MIIDVYSEIYGFTCHHCGHSWRATYGVRQVEDAQGGIWRHYSVAGSPSVSPASELLCPKCKHATVSYTVVGRHRLPASSLVGNDEVHGIDVIDGNIESVRDNAPYTSEELPRHERAIVAPEHTRTTSKIIVGVDRSPSGLLALRRAAAEARAKQADLEIVVAWEPEVGFGFTATTPDGLEREARRGRMIT